MIFCSVLWRQKPNVNVQKSVWTSCFRCFIRFALESIIRQLVESKANIRHVNKCCLWLNRLDGPETRLWTALLASKRTKLKALKGDLMCRVANARITSCFAEGSMAFAVSLFEAFNLHIFPPERINSSSLLRRVALLFDGVSYWISLTAQFVRSSRGTKPLMELISREILGKPRLMRPWRVHSTSAQHLLGNARSLDRPWDTFGMVRVRS